MAPDLQGWVVLPFGSIILASLATRASVAQLKTGADEMAALARPLARLGGAGGA